MSSISISGLNSLTIPLSYNPQDWVKGYESLPEEFDYWIDEITGEIPPELHGTLFRNGPGLLEVNGMPIPHPFDGDGMICAIAFDQGRAHFRNRFVRTAGYLAEQAAGKILYRGFGTQRPGGCLANAFDLKCKNAANTSVLYWGGKLLALWEGGEPHQLDPRTLDTIGLDNLNGALSPGEAFSAHPRIEPHSERDGGAPCLVNFSVKPGLSSKITVREFNWEGDVLRRYATSLPGFAFIHDMGISPNYCIFFQNPLTINPWLFIFGMRPLGQCLEFQPNQPTKILLMSRQDGTAHVLEADPCFVFHHANAFEEGENIYIDSICYDSLLANDIDGDFREINFERLPVPQLWRFEINLRQQTVTRQLMESRYCEMPVVPPQKVGKPYRFLYVAAANRIIQGSGPLQAVMKIDFQSEERQEWSVAPRGFISEPVFVPRPGGSAEDDGWLLAVVYDSDRHRSDVVILDARNLTAGPMARLHLRHHVPHSFHGNFTSDFLV